VAYRQTYFTSFDGRQTLRARIGTHADPYNIVPGDTIRLRLHATAGYPASRRAAEITRNDKPFCRIFLAPYRNLLLRHLDQFAIVANAPAERRFAAQVALLRRWLSHRG
jgi:hypothetical protein